MKFRRPPAVLKPACECGWELPNSVLSYTYGVQPDADRALRAVYVGLNCPLCGAGHTFMNAEDPDAMAEVERQARLKEQVLKSRGQA